MCEGGRKWGNIVNIMSKIKKGGKKDKPEFYFPKYF